MIADAYNVHLYCDNLDTQTCVGPRFLVGPQAEFSGETMREVRSAIRRNGWLVDWKLRTCICPDCAKEKKGNFHANR